MGKSEGRLSPIVRSILGVLLACPLAYLGTFVGANLGSNVASWGGLGDLGTTVALVIGGGLGILAGISIAYFITSGRGSSQAR